VRVLFTRETFKTVL